MTARRAGSDSTTPEQGPADAPDAPADSGDGTADVLAALNAGQMTQEEALARYSQARGVKVLLETPAELDLAKGEKDLSGLYELTCLQWDEPSIELKPHPLSGVLVEFERFERHRKGDLVQLSHQQAKRLIRAKAVVEPGVREAAAAAKAEEFAKAAADAARQARQRLEQVQSVAAKKTSVVEQWKAGAEAGEQRRAELDRAAQEAWESQPRTEQEMAARLRQAGLG